MTMLRSSNLPKKSIRTHAPHAPLPLNDPPLDIDSVAERCGGVTLPIVALPVRGTSDVVDITFYIYTQSSHSFPPITGI